MPEGGIVHGPRHRIASGRPPLPDESSCFAGARRRSLPCRENSIMQRLAAITGLLAVFLLPRVADARTWEVTTPADKGPGSLRDAIDQANRWRGPDLITFHIAAAGVQTI